MRARARLSTVDRARGDDLKSRGMRSLLVALLVAGCGGSSSTPAVPDMTLVLDLTIRSSCGRPGDPGNELGVGKFCQKNSECQANSKATLCTNPVNPENYFCTFACTKNGPPDQCGTKARCACQGNLCGCFPTACDGPLPDGGSGD
jgi:hypothetical protein